MVVFTLEVISAQTTFGSTVSATHTVSQRLKLEKGKFCQVVIDNLRPGEATSRILSQRCANQPMAIPRNDTLIMTWYQDKDFNQGNHNAPSTAILRPNGPC